MRSIDAEALEKLFEEECAGECPICIYSHEGCPCGLIKTAPTVPNEYMRGYEAAEREYKRSTYEWTPVKDPPKENGFYLVTALGYGKRPYMKFLGYDAIRKKWGEGGVVAWCNISPYKQEAEND